jgi:hypothetical protein
MPRLGHGHFLPTPFQFFSHSTAQRNIIWIPKASLKVPVNSDALFQNLDTEMFLRSRLCALRFKHHVFSLLCFCLMLLHILANHKMRICCFVREEECILKNVVFWDVALCTSGVNRRFGGTYRLHLQGRKIRERGTSVSSKIYTAPQPRKRHPSWAPL